jgi:hypothetical protein
MARKRNSPTNETPRRRGQPAFKPNDAQRDMVKLMTGFGIPQDRIRLIIPNPNTGNPITKETLEIAFREEIRVGSMEMDGIAMTSLARRVKEGNMTAIIWYMKNRMGWKDVVQNQNQQIGPNGEIIDATVPLFPPKLTLVFAREQAEDVTQPGPKEAKDDNDTAA